MSGQTAIRVEHLGKRFGAGPLVLDDVNLTISAGEFVCLLGASGCGKSTLLNLIAGLDRPTTGAIETPAEGSAVMFQESALMPWLTARANVELALRLRGVPRAQRAGVARELLDVVNLADAAEKRPHELSGGMRQRVALARALAQDRPVLLMDEPFAALDAITRDLLHEELERVWRQTGRTIVFVTHNVREAARLGQRVVLLSSRPGRVAGEWRIAETAGRRIESPEVAALSIEITEQLRKEIRRNAA
ncbi:ABC transporter ATP-binding protein [Agromyces sp. NPDC056523]|uniref:ABC transporter ATP-binding protein n=1 Tax=Agromyces sp. NPDC056523 TaxID=3345850 RepID=UPI0036704CFD